MTSFALVVYKVKSGSVGVDTEGAKVRLKNLMCYVIELELNLKPIGNLWWVLILRDKLLY